MTVEREALVEVASAISEQLDVDRLLVALHTQCMAYLGANTAQADEVAGLLRELGQLLTTLAGLRGQSCGTALKARSNQATSPLLVRLGLANRLPRPRHNRWTIANPMDYNFDA